MNIVLVDFIQYFAFKAEVNWINTKKEIYSLSYGKVSTQLKAKILLFSSCVLLGRTFFETGITLKDR